LSDAARSYDFEPLEASDPPPRDAMARILAQAMADGERIRESARAEGYEQGRAAGHEQGMAEIANAAGALGEAVRAVEGLRVETVQTVEKDSIKLAIALSNKILMGALQARPELVVEVVQGALRRISDRRTITVLVNPADLEVVKGAVGRLTGQGSGVEVCDVQADERVEPGSAVVRTGEGEVDAGVYTQLERASEVAAAALEADGQAA
jgi:flagellar assembly protein FliH